MNAEPIDNPTRLREMARLLTAARSPSPLGAYDAVDLEGAAREIEALRGENARLREELESVDNDLADTRDDLKRRDRIADLPKMTDEEFRKLIDSIPTTATLPETTWD